MTGTGIKMRFSAHSDEEMCGKPVDLPCGQGETLLVACMRTDGHEPPCISAAGNAGEADGVRFCCRVPLNASGSRAPSDAPHAVWCPLQRSDITNQLGELPAD